MTYRPLKTVCRQIACCAMQDAAREEERRWIWTESDFTAADLQRIERFEAAAFSALAANAGNAWDSALAALRVQFPYTRFGFKSQDRILSACRSAGIRFSDR